MPLSNWARSEVEAGGWVRRMFQQGQRLRAVHGADAVADLSLGQPLEATRQVREAFQRSAAESGPSRFQYMPNLGYPDLRDRIAHWVDPGGAISASSVAVTIGAAGAISLALRTFLDPSERVVVLAPYFAEFRLYATAAGLRFTAVDPSPDAGIDLGALEAALAEPTGAVIVNSPCNPSGHIVDDSEMRQIAQLLNRHDRGAGRRPLLIVDEVYHQLVFPPHRHGDPFASYDNAVLARSFSKDLGVAGERIGYLVMHPALADPETERGLELTQRALGYVNAPATAQRALLHLDDWSPDVESYRRRRDLATNAMRAAGLSVPETRGGLYLWIPSPWPDTLEFVNTLAAERVLLSPGIAFGDPSHVRLCFSAPEPALIMAGEVTARVIAQGPPTARGAEAG